MGEGPQSIGAGGSRLAVVVEAVPFLQLLARVAFFLGEERPHDLSLGIADGHAHVAGGRVVVADVDGKPALRRLRGIERSLARCLRCQGRGGLVGGDHVEAAPGVRCLEMEARRGDHVEEVVDDAAAGVSPERLQRAPPCGSGHGLLLENRPRDPPLEGIAARDLAVVHAAGGAGEHLRIAVRHASLHEQAGLLLVGEKPAREMHDGVAVALFRGHGPGEIGVGDESQLQGVAFPGLVGADGRILTVDQRRWILDAGGDEQAGIVPGERNLHRVEVEHLRIGAEGDEGLRLPVARVAVDGERSVGGRGRGGKHVDLAVHERAVGVASGEGGRCGDGDESGRCHSRCDTDRAEERIRGGGCRRVMRGHDCLPKVQWKAGALQEDLAADRDI